MDKNSELRRQRDKYIIKDRFENKLSISIIAKKYKLSIYRVHEIVRQYNEKYIIPNNNGVIRLLDLEELKEHSQLLNTLYIYNIVTLDDLLTYRSAKSLASLKGIGPKFLIKLENVVKKYKVNKN